MGSNFALDTDALRLRLDHVIVGKLVCACLALAARYIKTAGLMMLLSEIPLRASAYYLLKSNYTRQQHY